jgi:hypothetical protein
MAVTITQSPFNFSGFRQRNNLVLATSTNSTQPGFKYKVTVRADNRQLYRGYVSPNISGALVFDLYPVLQQLGQMIKANNTNVHRFSSASTVCVQEAYKGSSNTLAGQKVQVEIDEAWNVFGVFTDNPDNYSGDLIQRIMFNRAAQFADGYKPNPTTYAQLSANTSRMLSDRLPTTLEWYLSQSVGLGAPDATKVYIPVRRQDFGTIGFAFTSSANRSTNNMPGYVAEKINVRLIPVSGSPMDYTETITSFEDGILHAGCYPGNILASTVAGLASIQAQLSAGTWSAYLVRALTGANAQCSVSYILYNADRFNELNCKHDTVRLAFHQCVRRVGLPKLHPEKRRVNQCGAQRVQEDSRQFRHSDDRI